MSSRSSLRVTALAGLGTALVAWPLAWNGFPFVYWDTSEYLWRWAAMRPGFDRPLFYSLLLAAFRIVPFGLYAAALAQAACVSLLVIALARSVLPPGRAPSGSVTALLLIAVSPAAFHAVTLMPDFSALLLALALPVAILASQARLAWLAGAAAALATTLHTSNLVILAAMALPAIAAAHLAGCSVRRPALVVAAAIALQPLAMSWNSARGGLGPVPRPTGSPFFLGARLQESGDLERSFRELAAAPRGGLTRETAERWATALGKQERSVAGLLWSPDSPLNREFPAWRDEVPAYRGAVAVLDPAVRHALRAHPGPFLRTGLANAREIASGRFQLEGFVPHGEGSGVQRVLEERWGRNLPRYRASRQARGETPARSLPRFTALWTNLAPVAVGLAGLLAVAACAALARRRGRPEWAAALLLCLFVLFDVVACGIFGMSASRYLERVVPLPFVAAGLLALARAFTPPAAA